MSIVLENVNMQKKSVKRNRQKHVDTVTMISINLLSCCNKFFLPYESMNDWEKPNWSLLQKKKNFTVT